MSELRFVVSGVPVPQGSLKHVGRGRFVSDNTRLGPWRDKVSAAALALGGPGWRDVDEPVSLHVAFYLKRPQRPRFTAPAVKPDLDKLQRAIGDALSPRTGPKILAEDSRIIRATTEKHYAAPGEERAEITLRKETP